MLYWAFVSLCVAVISGAFCSAGVPDEAAAIARVLFLVSSLAFLGTVIAIPLRRWGWRP